MGRGYASLARVHPRTLELVDDVPVGNDPVALETGAGAVWVVDQDDGTLARIDPRSANAVTWATQVGQAPVALALGEDAIWVASSQSDTVSRVDPENGAVTAVIPVGRHPTGVATGAGAVWVANSLDGTVSRIDPETNQVAATIAVGQAPRSVTFADDRVWVSVQSGEPQSPAPASSEGVARVLLQSDPGPTDPALDVDFTRQGAICARLYNYPDRPAPEGAQLVPEIAAGPPTVSAGGRRYEFRIRSGYRFSPPSGEPVTAASFARAIERTLDPRMGSYGGMLMGDIVGAEAFAAGRARDVTGLEARGDRLIIELTRPAGDLAARLSATFFCPVPPGTPVDREGVDLLPSAGPYYAASHAPERSLVLRRNPNYDGPRPQGLAEIRYDIGWSADRALAEVEAGRADYLEQDAFTANEPLSTADVAELDARLGPDSEAAGPGDPVFLTQPSLSTYQFAFNATRPPFDDVRLRRAVSYAIDRHALAEYTGFGDPARPTDQFLPPGIPGYEDVAAYPLGGPDLERARRLAAGFSGPAVLYTCDYPDCARHAEILRSNLAAIGIDLTVRQFTHSGAVQAREHARGAVRPRVLQLVRRLRRPAQLPPALGRRRFPWAPARRPPRRPGLRAGRAAERGSPARGLRPDRPHAGRGRGARGRLRQRHRLAPPLVTDGLPGPAPGLQPGPRRALHRGRVDQAASATAQARGARATTASASGAITASPAGRLMPSARKPIVAGPARNPA